MPYDGETVQKCRKFIILSRRRRIFPGCSRGDSSHHSSGRAAVEGPDPNTAQLTCKSIEGKGSDKDFKDLTEEQRAKARACNTSDELVELALKEGVELSIDQLDDASGGSWNSAPDCDTLNSSPV